MCETSVTVCRTACRLLHLCEIGSIDIVIMVFYYLWCTVIVVVFIFRCDPVDMMRHKHSNQTPLTQHRVRGEISSVCFSLVCLFSFCLFLM